MSINPRLGGTVSHSGTMPTPESAPGESGPPERPITVLFMLVTIALVGAVLYLSEQHFIDDPVAQAQRGEIAGLSDGSLVVEPNLARALRAVKKRAGRSSIKNLRLSPVSLDMTIQDPDGRESIFKVDPAFQVTENDFGDSTDPGFPYRGVDLAAPEKIARAVARKAKADVDDLDYMVLNRTPAFAATGGKAYSWTIFLKRDVPIARRQWNAAGDGSDLRKLGTLPSSERRRQARQQRDARSQQRKIKARARCFSKADEAADLQRCIARFD